MGTVSAGAAMSLDGFIADPSGEVGPLFDWYFNGDVEFPTAGGRWVFKTSEASAKHLREIWNSAGALVSAAELYTTVRPSGAKRAL